jgi:hypothetical protein
VVVTPNNYRAVGIAIVPATVPAAVMSVKLGTGAAIFIAIVVPIATDADAKPLGARHGRRGNREGRQRSESARKLLHFASPIVVAQGENEWAKVAFREQAWNFFEQLFSQIASLSQPLAAIETKFSPALAATSSWLRHKVLRHYHYRTTSR